MSNDLLYRQGGQFKLCRALPAKCPTRKGKRRLAEVERYYNMVEQNEPTNIEAIFYSAYGKAMQSLVDSDPYKREAAFSSHG